MNVKLNLFLLILSFVTLWGDFANSSIDEGLYLSQSEKSIIALALLNVDKTPEVSYQALLKYISRLNSNPQLIKVENFQDFLAKWRGSLPLTSSESKNSSLIQQTARHLMITSDNPRIQRKIDQFLVNRIYKFKDRLDESKDSSFITANQLNDLLINYLKIIRTLNLNINSESQNPPKDIQFLKNSKLMALQSEISNELFMLFDQYLVKQGQDLAIKAFSQIKDPFYKVVLETLFQEYFVGLSVETKRGMIMQVLDGNLQLNQQEMTKIILQNSGPQIQKLLQIIAHDKNLPEDIQKMFIQFESEVKPVSSIEVDELYAKESQLYKFKYFERKALGVGSIAQTHRAKIVIDGEIKSVVIRFIKPNISARIDEDHRILMKVAQIVDHHPSLEGISHPLLTPMIGLITQNVRAELIMLDTIHQQRQGQKIYNNEFYIEDNEYKNLVRLKVPTVFESVAGSQLMIQELVVGSKFDKEFKVFDELAPDYKKKVIQKLGEIWLGEAFLGSGFFHSDLHKGNMLVSIKDESIDVTLLDFGMVGIMNKSLQKNSFILGAGIEFYKAKAIFDSLIKLNQNKKLKMSRIELQRLVEERVQQIKNHSEVQAKEMNSIDKWVAWASQLGIEFPSQFISLNRGLMILKEMFEKEDLKLNFIKLMIPSVKAHPLKTIEFLVDSGEFNYTELALWGIKKYWDKPIIQSQSFKVNVLTEHPPICSTLFSSQN